MKSHRRFPLAPSFLPLVSLVLFFAPSFAQSGLSASWSLRYRAASPAPTVPPGPTEPTGANAIGVLKVQVPFGTGPFVVHGTLPIDLVPFDRLACPYTLMTPDGEWLDTQWELVARLQHTMVIELRAVCPENRWGGTQPFTILEQPSSFQTENFSREAIGVAITPNAVQLEIEDQLGGLHYRSLTGFDSSQPIHRIGPATVTLQRAYNDEFGGGQSWTTVNADMTQLEFAINWNNGTLPARPDVYFRSLKLIVPPGWTWSSFLPDPALGGGYLVKPDNHVIPQRMERLFRVIVHKEGETPDLSYRGWGVGDWSQGSYLAQAVPLPDLGHLSINLADQQAEDYWRLQQNLPTVPGDTPVNFLWPARGVKYGGMTSGFDVYEFEGVQPAVTAQTEGILSLFVEQLRYGARQMGCIYDPLSRPIRIEDYRNSNGTLPWSFFNNQFVGNPPKDAPFYFSQTGPGTGSASYDPLEYEPIDDQHMIRRTKASKVLVWLDNDPLSRLYLEMDATLKRMTFYEGPGGRVALPVQKALGMPWGRAEAWAADALATMYAISDDVWRARHYAWFELFALALYRTQMPSGLFSAIDGGKVATTPPYGHRLDEPCPWGIHVLQASSSEVPDFRVHRANEQVYLMMALRAIQETVGIDTGDMIRFCGEGLWGLAWKPGTDGMLDRYPAGPISGNPYTTMAEIPAGLTATVPKDNFNVGEGLYMGMVEGAQLLPALYAYTSTTSLAGALAELQRPNSNLYIENFAPLLTLLQQSLP